MLASFFNVHGSVHRNNILICIQQDGTLHSLFYLESALHVSGSTTTHHQEPNNCIYSIWYLSHLYCYLPLYIQQDATLHSLFYLESALHISGGTSTHHQKRKQLYLQHPVFVTPLLLPAAIYPTRCSVTQFILSGNCSTCFGVTLHLVGYMLE
jgi:hypothetical protein